MVKIGAKQWFKEKASVIEENIRISIVKKIGTALDDHEGTVKNIFGEAEEQDLIKGIVVEIDKKDMDVIIFKMGDSFIKLEIKEKRRTPRITRIRYGGNKATLIADRVSTFLNRTIIRETGKKGKIGYKQKIPDHDDQEFHWKRRL